MAILVCSKKNTILVFLSKKTGFFFEIRMATKAVVKKIYNRKKIEYIYKKIIII